MLDNPPSLLTRVPIVTNNRVGKKRMGERTMDELKLGGMGKMPDTLRPFIPVTRPLVPTTPPILPPPRRNEKSRVNRVLDVIVGVLVAVVVLRLVAQLFEGFAAKLPSVETCISVAIPIAVGVYVAIVLVKVEEAADKIRREPPKSPPPPGV